MILYYNIHSDNFSRVVNIWIHFPCEPARLLYTCAWAPNCNSVPSQDIESICVSTIIALCACVVENAAKLVRGAPSSWSVHSPPDGSLKLCLIYMYVIASGCGFIACLKFESFGVSVNKDWLTEYVCVCVLKRNTKERNFALLCTKFSERSIFAQRVVIVIQQKIYPLENLRMSHFVQCFTIRYRKNPVQWYIKFRFSFSPCLRDFICFCVNLLVWGYISFRFSISRNWLEQWCPERSTRWWVACWRHLWPPRWFTDCPHSRR